MSNGPRIPRRSEVAELADVLWDEYQRRRSLTCAWANPAVDPSVVHRELGRPQPEVVLPVERHEGYIEGFRHGAWHGALAGLLLGAAIVGGAIQLGWWVG